MTPRDPHAMADLAQQLATATRWPLPHCHKVLDDKLTELANSGIKYPHALLAKIVASNPNHLPAPLVVRRVAAPPMP